MAKQTFTTGQVLTAAQMTSLQQTAMGGGSATAKTASYTLVAADAGATVIMNSASATTITVNTSLFSAGDTVFLQNIGAGISTVTAGTATVNTASSLALAQYESGTLYFTAAGASIFSKADGAAAAGGGMTLLSTTTLSGASTEISSISGSYKDLLIEAYNITNDTGNGNLKLQISTPAPSAANYSVGIYWAGGAYQNNNASDGTNYSHVPTYNWNRNVGSNQIQLYIPRYADSSNNMKIAYCYGYFRGSGNDSVVFNTNFGREISTAVSAIKFEQSGGSFLTGTVKIYGVN